MAGESDAVFKRLAVPAVCALIAFLAYPSQLLFSIAENLDPGPPTTRQTYIFNTLLACLWWTYYKACTVHPGRYDPKMSPAAQTNPVGAVPTSQEPETGKKKDNGSPSDDPSGAKIPGGPGTRWCRKCSAPKPPRAHHCRHCRRCIPRMDHHCPWTANCVSLTTFPHFLRFLAYANLSLWYLSYLLYLRFAALWAERGWPSYLGPSLPAMISLTGLALVCFMTEFALGLILVSTVRGWLFNTTTIEDAEIEKYERNYARGDSWWEDGYSDEDGEGDKLPAEKIEFPYDVGIFANMSQAMGTRNFLQWLNPLAGNPVISPDGRGSGWAYEENGFNHREGLWPPPDPDRHRRAVGSPWSGPGATGVDDEGALPVYQSPEELKEAFHRRQQADLRRWRRQRDDILAELEEVDDYDDINSPSVGRIGRRDLRNERLRGRIGDADQGGDDEDIPLIRRIDDDDDDVPLGEIVRRRRAVLNNNDQE